MIRRGRGLSGLGLLNFNCAGGIRFLGRSTDDLEEFD